MNVAISQGPAGLEWTAENALSKKLWRGVFPKATSILWYQLGLRGLEETPWLTLPENRTDQTRMSAT
jgi:hypothetical protein